MAKKQYFVILDTETTMADTVADFAMIVVDREGKIYNQYRNDLADDNCYVIIATARVMFENDWQFVNEILGEPDYFISRKDGDNQSGKTLKINGLAKFFNLVTFKDADFVFYEDNVSYLKAVCDRFGIRGVYIPSVQGH